jgi:uncharacterized protein (TIGR04552 family)
LIRRDADILRLDLRPPAEQEPSLSLADLEAVRLVLRGGSSIDWHRLNFRTLSEVDDLLRSNLLDPDDPRDMARLAYLHRESLRYLKRNFAFRFPVEVEEPADVRHLFLYASEAGRLNRVQILSCVVLKTMHTINHLEARELLLEVPISEVELLQVVEEQVLQRARALTDEGLPIVHFYGSRKTRDSMISKLISKKDARAADILDKLRFRTVVETKEDIVPVLAYLLRHVFPWNQVTAGQSTNTLLNLHRHLRERDELQRLVPLLQEDIGIDDEEAREARNDNEFSGASYRMINFIIDVPVRLDHLLTRAGDPWLLQRGSIAYVGCEFQVVDQETAYLNEQGENSHARYKRRQQETVSDRLLWGLLRQRRRRADGAAGRSGLGARRPRAVGGLEAAPGLAEASVAQDEARRDPRPPRPALPEPPSARANGNGESRPGAPLPSSPSLSSSPSSAAAAPSPASAAPGAGGRQRRPVQPRGAEEDSLLEPLRHPDALDPERHRP